MLVKEIAKYRKLAYENKDSVSFQQYFDVLLKNAQSGNVNAQFDLALLYESEEIMNLIGQVVNKEASFKWYTRACKLGCGEACYNLANIYFDKEGMEEERIQLLRKAIYLGRPEAAYSLGKYYLRIGNLRRASNYFNKCIQLDKYWGEAYFELGEINYIQRKYKNAYQLFKQAIDTKYLTEDIIERMKFYFGKMYFYGQYIEKSVAKAKYLIDKAKKNSDNLDILAFYNEHKNVFKGVKKELVNLRCLPCV
jgi:TPR repeat protein